jgi:hypothetical protein
LSAELLEFVGERECMVRRDFGQRGGCGGVLHEDAPQRGDARPTGHGVVRYVEEARRFETAANESDDRLPVLCAYPAVNAVHTDDVEVRQRRIV